MSAESPNEVTMKGEPVSLRGPELEVGQEAPDFTAVHSDWSEVSLADFSGKVVLISAVVSVDTSVCSLQTQRFDREVEELPDGVVVLTISRDLPFALDRFCGAQGVERMHVLSDHPAGEFGESYGVLIEDMGLLARSVFVVDRAGRIAYKEIVPEVTDHPDYEAALEAARKAAE